MLIVLAVFGGCGSGPLPPPPGSPSTPAPLGTPVVQPTIPLSSRASAKGKPPGPAQAGENSPLVVEATPNTPNETKPTVAVDSVQPKTSGTPVTGSEAAGNFIAALARGGRSSKQGKSLLSAGIVRVEGDFTKGAVVSFVDQHGDEFARGLTNYDATSTRDIAGKRTDELTKSVGSLSLPRSHPPRQPRRDQPREKLTPLSTC